MRNKSTKRNLIFLLLCVTFLTGNAQITNYINNGGFEDGLQPPGQFNSVKFWGAIDTAKPAYYFVTKLQPYVNSPYCSFGYQYPRTGNNFIGCQFWCQGCERYYPRNRLKQKLKPNTVYCAKYHVVSTNNSRIAIDSYGMYFGDGTIDTITKCNNPITYLNPQVENQNGIIFDTLNWIPVTGTFVATGNEKYLLLGNFRSNTNTSTLAVIPPEEVHGSAVYIDDVSVIELDLPAFAGHDYYLIPGDSVFIGREPDVGIDEACIWYQLPNMQTAIDTVAGFWVKPAVTTSYVVRQEICGNVKWDTVVIYQSALGIQDSKFKVQRLEIFPNPADELLTLRFETANSFELNWLRIINCLGQIVREEEIVFKAQSASVKTDDLMNGIYVMELSGGGGKFLNKRFVVGR